MLLLIEKVFYIAYKLDTCSRYLNSDSALNDCLFQGAKLAKNADLDKYIYIGYGIGFNLFSKFLLSDGSMVKSVVIFGVDMSPSVHIDNKLKDILILGKGPIQELIFN